MTSNYFATSLISLQITVIPKFCARLIFSHQRKCTLCDHCIKGSQEKFATLFYCKSIMIKKQILREISNYIWRLTSSICLLLRCLELYTMTMNEWSKRRCRYFPYHFMSHEKFVLQNDNRIENIKSKQTNDTFFLDCWTVLVSINSNPCI